MILLLMNNSKYLFSLSPLLSREITDRISKEVGDGENTYTLVYDKFFRDKYPCISVLSNNLIEYEVRRDKSYTDYYMNCITFREDSQDINISFDCTDDEFMSQLIKLIESNKKDGIEKLLKLVNKVILVELGSGGWITSKDILLANSKCNLTIIKENKTEHYVNGEKL